ncbi:MAG: hypothetical protein ACXV8Q_06710 [Methylobacter sp.]
MAILIVAKRFERGNMPRPAIGLPQFKIAAHHVNQAIWSQAAKPGWPMTKANVQDGRHNLFAPDFRGYS